MSVLGHNRNHNPNSFLGFQCNPMASGDGDNEPQCEANPVCCENDAIVGVQSCRNFPS